MSLALLTLSLLVVAPARAGHWVVTYECSGSSSYMKVPEDQPKTTTGPFPNNWPTTFDSTTQCPPGADDYSPIYYYYPGYLGVDPDSDTRLLLSSASNSGSMVAVLTWTADSATDPSLPPLNVNVIETAQVVAAVDAQGHTPSVAVSDSFGDVPTPIATGDGWNNYGLMASGQHLLTLDNSSGQQVIRLPKRSFSATASGTPDSNGFQENFSQADVTYTVAPDTHARDVTITCPAVDTYADGGSQYRYPALTGPVIVNVRQSDGTLRGDTANYSGFSNGGTILSYTGSPTGSWAAGSQYHWNSSLTGNSTRVLG